MKLLDQRLNSRDDIFHRSRMRAHSLYHGWSTCSMEKGQLRNISSEINRTTVDGKGPGRDFHFYISHESRILPWFDALWRHPETGLLSTTPWSPSIWAETQKGFAIDQQQTPELQP